MNYFQNSLKILFTCAFMSIFSSSCAVRTVYVRPAPPAARVEVISSKPYHGAIWISGHWRWKHGRYVWKRGYWVKPQQGYVWIPGHWKRKHGGWFWKKGHWRSV